MGTSVFIQTKSIINYGNISDVRVMSMDVSIRIYANVKTEGIFKMTIKFNYPNKTHNDYLKSLVQALVRRRKELGMTQEQLNYNLGMADRLVSKWEVGTRTPLTFNLYCWADELKSDLMIIPHPIETPSLVSSLKENIANDNGSLGANAVNDNELIIPQRKMKTCL